MTEEYDFSSDVDEVNRLYSRFPKIIQGRYSFRSQLLYMLEDEMGIGAVGQGQAYGSCTRYATIVADGEVTLLPCEHWQVLVTWSGPLRYIHGEWSLWVVNGT